MDPRYEGNSYGRQPTGKNGDHGVETIELGSRGGEIQRAMNNMLPRYSTLTIHR